MELQKIELYDKFVDFYVYSYRTKYHASIVYLSDGLGYTLLPRLSHKMTVETYDKIMDSEVIITYLDPSKKDIMCIDLISSFKYIIDLPYMLSLFVDYQIDDDFKQSYKKLDIITFKKAFYDLGSVEFDKYTFSVFYKFLELISFKSLIKYLQQKIYLDGDKSKQFSSELYISRLIQLFLYDMLEKSCKLSLSSDI